ncbi:30S ribosomal protein S23 [Rhodonellum psychrophilum GCM71 = DSM 17998]|uniref:30S ribosomal protein S23 n=2 Tax=Rhodonellum TaxID=336827 RepID=U5BVT0_9BACT|nr:MULTISPECIES: four helix bundle protein [Rhodonellum]ERM81968.1 30S ribosomal protein S23 [Rhodonellum psychrophilum GCM71 = DSM 17998]SDY69700.1 four helix bundle protein [Rhodonellum ikkaensis]
MNRYKDLKVWQKAIQLSVDIYQITGRFPKEERFGLVSQMNRASVSIPSNIAEGAGRNGPKDFNNFLGIALGSCFELDTQLVISNKLNYLSDQEFEKFELELEHIQNMIVKLKKSLNIQ